MRRRTIEKPPELVSGGCEIEVIHYGKSLYILL